MTVFSMPAAIKPGALERKSAGFGDAGSRLRENVA